MISSILIANRGEIAVRIIRTCREMKIRTIAIHSTADAEAMHVRLADMALCVGPPSPRDSYLNIPAIMAAAVVSGADAIHPGYGFLSENASFAEAVEAHGLVFIGPSAAHIRMMGDKIRAKATMKEFGVPVVPGTEAAVTDVDDARVIAEEIGYPVLVKAAAGGGGRGMKVARASAELDEAISVAQAEARAAFGDGSVYLEKYLDTPRHIEVQVLGDQFGSVVHFGERDCSLQRRHQKLVEEAGSPALSDTERNEIGTVVTSALQKIGYRNAGTIEFLYQDSRFYFIEMNTRLQVEHPVTEMVCGIDLVREQIRVARGEPIGYGQEQIRFTGHAIECRITAEDPSTFIPSPGTISFFHQPGGIGVRMDTAVYSGYKVPPYYDSMIGKLIVHASSRGEAIDRMRRALDECVMQGLKTVLPLLRAIMRDEEFESGDYTIHWLENFVMRFTPDQTEDEKKA
ncbi:acetyl-CoA carboxylase biotin carboxylase subunit [Komagataeibacter nataicola]|uniref:acetyl-CoA carboxylase biotin carboxylase subunit n=1 Tax=Komagataeibacter TaxID=1434011 RepID=UPI00168AE866|nr:MULTISPECIES: acetyl-CoA carboxylase biotin carboxylase subunit [Komagataeibacter]QOC46015.1 acetyl-CoA carboxylase biotin carboxylase subunit [Komagataeibacter rhaeticus]WEQ55787.1 acetyl-CoA carboxylase biotin carboxylase subunit [Komagataeibacter nataicola]